MAKNLVQHAESHPELKEALVDFAICVVDIDKPEEITFEKQKILAEINKYFSENIEKALPNYYELIPNKNEYKLIIEGLSGVKEMQDFAVESNQGEKITMTHAEVESKLFSPTSKAIVASSIYGVIAGLAVGGGLFAAGVCIADIGDDWYRCSCCSSNRTCCWWYYIYSIKT